MGIDKQGKIVYNNRREKRKRGAEMKILIAYATKTGTVTKCVESLKTELHGLDVTVADLEVEHPDPADFDMVILGSSIRFSRIRKALNSYLQTNGEAVKKMPHGFFLCCGFGHEFERYAETQLGAELTDSAFAVMSFGGLLKLEKTSFWERYFLFRVRCMIRESEIDDQEYTPALPSVLPENISRMATAVREALRRQSNG